MNYLTKICQFIFHTFLISSLCFLLGCSSKNDRSSETRSEQDFIESEKPLSLWFDSPDSFKRTNVEGEVTFHPFYDLKNDQKSLEHLEVNYFVSNEEKSPFYYLFDLSSGKTYKKHQFCSHQDIWKKNSSNIKGPNFTIGFLPRLLGIDKRPQEIWVFGKSNKYQSVDHKAHVIGGVILQRCESYPCDRNSDWKSNLILLGVDTSGNKFKNVKSIEDLKKKVDWDYFEAFIQSAWGHTYISNHFYPVYRITSYVDGKKALDYVYKKGHLFTDDELSEMKKSCLKLYDYFYKETFEKDQKEKDFSDLFYEFYRDHKKHFKTCYHYIPPGKVIGDSKEFWFYNFMAPVLLLDELGHHYDCYRKAWIRKDENRLLKESEIWKGCTLKEVKSAFSGVSSYITNLAGSYQPHVRFVEYDNGVGGSHQKVFSWVFDDAKALNCSLKEYDKRVLYPEKLDWDQFHFPEKMIKDEEFEVIR